jgi:hypothetical protein
VIIEKGFTFALPKTISIFGDKKFKKRGGKKTSKNS